MTWPLPVGKNRIRGGILNNTFGNVRKNGDGSPRVHQGWDFAAPVGTPCHAVSDGKIVAVDSAGAYGLTCLLQYAPDRWAFYAHLSAIEVTVGEQVTAGSVIGYTGRSGNASLLPKDGSQDHLHFEIRTTPAPPKGLSGRLSPLTFFGLCPLHTPV